MNHVVRIAVALSMIALPLAAIDDPVRTGNGLVAGIAGIRPGVRVYKGIPFAAPPVGQLRWRAPEAPASWEGVRQAAEFSANCVQTPYPQTSIYYSEPRPIAEDCLYLHVWTAAK